MTEVMADQMPEPGVENRVRGSQQTLHLGEQQLAGVVFVPVPGAPARPHRIHGTGRADIVHVSTDDLTRTAHIRRTLIDQISKAKHKVLFCSFLFADEEIVRALCEAAERLQGGVYVLTALGKHLRAEILELESEIDANIARQQERARRHEDHLQRLAHAGVWLRSTEDCHAKFCVVDDVCAIVTSANATQEAYESNPEDGLVLHGVGPARELGRLFAHVWQHLSTLESTPGARLDVHTLPDARAPAWRALAGAAGIRPVTTLRGDEQSLQEAAIVVIDQAENHLAIATYSFMGMEGHPVGAALARALARNVRIDLLVQPRNHVKAQRASLAWLTGLAPDQVQIHGHRRTHTKSIVADGRTVLLWTGNLDSRHGWEDGIEVGIVIDDAGVAAAVAGWTADVMERRTHAALNAPSARELVAAGQPSALPGEWTLHLPAGMAAGATIAAFSKNAAELLEAQESLFLRCADEQLLEVQVDEASRRLDVLRNRRADGLMGCRSKGWLSESILHIVAAPVPSPHPKQVMPKQKHKGRKGGKR